MKTSIAILSAMVGLVGIGFAGTARAAVPAWSIAEVKYAGSGCPDGTATADVTDGGESFTVSFTSFTAQAGPGLPLTEAVKSCNLSINVNKPEGWQFTVASIAWRGHALLGEGVSAKLSARYSFPGTPSVMDSEMRRGAVDEDFEVLNTFNDSAPWSRCGAGVTTLRATGTASVDNHMNREESGIVEAAESSGVLQLECDLNWRPCECSDCH